jgi:hypothetical protein
LAELKVDDICFAPVAAAMGLASGFRLLSGSLLGARHGILLVCRFSGENLACAGDDGAMGIIFLVEDITVRTIV